MLTNRILCVGKLKEQYWRDACNEYGKRLSAFCRFSIEELPECRLSEKPSTKEIEAALEKEAEQLLKKAGNAKIIALCIEGQMISSEKLSAQIERFMVEGGSELAWVIGSSWGLAEIVKNRAVMRLSMSRMTFPHQLARVMLCEQLYRAFQISTAGKYHK